MGRVSRKKIHTDVQKELEEQLTTIIASLYQKKEIAVFLNEFLTKEEKVMLGKRLVLYMLLTRGMLSEDIHKALGITYDTIRLYKLLLASKPVEFQKSIQKLIRKKNSQELWKKIDKVLMPLDLVMNAKTNMQARAKLLSGDWYNVK